ncbi:tryptophan halogenase family protein [Sphingomonas carotinifaciens]|uniref:Tryptophan halogenase n=1 Tax=Sphingomonas carotinifaciens TaxID=1166323 RepID=A0A1G7GEL9_9SPHN|nr:tryptophan halogenase family protein [Sphingomonas carotinifaciens]MBB4086487.1 tryptophan halogenase [Sphingomonas carotinifaciens]MWC42839.1 tryptophan halogenase [Sphingomonas carotinifaciens]SDE86580.1 tryptophan halogenase [Sphingomonas carotinifaciens]
MAGQERNRVRVVVVGGGTAGWMTAAGLATLIPAAADVHLVESAEIGIVGVGEATLPHLRAFIQRLGIDEIAFMTATHATFKLGIDFRDFGRIGDRYVHPFGTYGQPLGGVGFHHYWLRRHHGGNPTPLGAYSAGVVAGERARFARPDPTSDALQDSFGYAYQFDATRFAPFLRTHAEARGCRRTEGRVVSVGRDERDGRVTAIHLADGTRIEGDLFVDCSGFRALLIGGELDEAWEDWSHWLPCDRAVAVPCTHAPGPIEPLTRATAMPAGWRWRIPLTTRVGNGYVYASRYCDEDTAREALLAGLEGEALAEPRLLRFRAGRRRHSWSHNVVAVGLASGFLEPLESTSIYLVQMAITALIEHFPDARVTDADRDGFNTAVDAEYDRIRDFLILHYHATTRDDSPFWDHVRTMAIPDTLADRIALWRQTAQVAHYSYGLFLEPSWLAVYLGQNIVPDGWDPRADGADPAKLDQALAALAAGIGTAIDALPPHEASLPR